MIKVLTPFAVIAMIVFGFISAYALFVGLTFGFSLWDPANPTITWLWLGVVCAPLPIAVALRWWRTSLPLLSLSLAAACALFAPYVLAFIYRW